MDHYAGTMIQYTKRTNSGIEEEERVKRSRLNAVSAKSLPGRFVYSEQRQDVGLSIVSGITGRAGVKYMARN